MACGTKFSSYIPLWIQLVDKYILNSNTPAHAAAKKNTFVHSTSLQVTIIFRTLV